MRTKNHGVLFVGNFLSSARGTQGICEVLADRFAKNGWFVTTTSNKIGRLRRLYDMLLQTWRSRSTYNIALVDVFSGPSFFWAEAVCRLLRHLHTPYILTLRGGKLPHFSQRWPRRVQSLLCGATFVTTPSKYMASELKWARPDIIYLPNGIDLSKYQYVHRKLVSPKLAWLRAFNAIYNPIMAAKALSLLVDEFPDIELTMLGPDTGDGSLNVMQDWARRAGVAHRIHAPGAIPKTEVPHVLARYDIFLNTTTAESFGVSVMEAAALGMCIVTTNVGELPYMWTHEHDALLVPPNDPEAMANCIRRILTEPDLAESLSRNARAKAEQFDWSVVLPPWETILHEAIAKGAS